MNTARVGHLAAVMTLVYIRVNVCLIMAQVLGGRLGIIGWEMTPIIRRLPCRISYLDDRCIEGGSLDKYRLNDIVGTVDIRLADNLAIRSGVTHLKIDGGYVLEEIVCQNSLYYIHVVIAVYHFHHSQIVHKTVVIKVKIGYHIS